MQELSVLKGIGEVRLRLFEKKGITTVEELVGYYPRDYEDRSQTKDIADTLPGEDVLIRARILTSVKENRIRKNMVIYSLAAGDESGIISIIWYNNRFVKNAFKAGEEFVFFGKLNPHSRKKEMINPIYERVGKERYTGKIVPIYPLWDKMTQKILQSAMSEAIKNIGTVEEYLNEEIIKKNSRKIVLMRK